MNYYAIIKTLYPTIQDSEFMLSDDGAGNITIPKWTFQGASKPSVATLQAASAQGELWQAQRDKINSLAALCAAQILGGFSSSALGSANTYPSNEGNGFYDQTNLINAATASLAPGLAGNWTTPLWCSSGGSWDFLAHTATQVQQVIADFTTAKNTARQNLATKTASVNAAETTDAVNAITW